MYYELYLDVVFLTNFLMDYLILRLVNKALKRSSCRIRCLAGGAIGAFGVCLFLLLPIHKSIVNVLPVHVVTSTLMVKIGCKIKDVRNLVRCVIAMYLITFLWGGIFLVLLQSPAALHLRTFLFISIFTYELLSFGICIYGCHKRRRSRFCDVTLYVNEKSKKVRGLYDTGNLLTDSLSGRPVSVVDAKAVEELFSEPPEYNEALKPHYLSYHAIGTDRGILLAITIDGMRIELEDGEHFIPHPVLALNQGNVSFTQHYQLILNPNLIDC